MKKEPKYKKIRRLCFAYINDKATFKDITDLIHKKHLRSFMSGVHSKKAAKNPYVKQKWGVYFYELFESGSLIGRAFYKRENQKDII